LALSPDPERSRGRALLACVLTILAASASVAAPESLDLRFARHGELVATATLANLRDQFPTSHVRVHEPYETGEVTFEALPFAAVLDVIYSRSWRDEEELLFTCSDGYQPTVSVQRLLQHRAWLAFDRVGEPGFSILKLESGQRERIELGPFYLVWENLDDPRVRQEGDYGWPYQLVGVDLIRTADRFPRMLPPADAPEAVRDGFAAFRVHCSRCHAINGEGGHIGPELNAPVSAVELRDADWLRRWLDDPSQISPESRMPRLNPALPDRERTLTEILSYLEAMSRAKPALTSNRADER
jgi:mono/diheme cytochrome c family protein